jgi:hydrogenase maturation protease
LGKTRTKLIIGCGNLLLKDEGFGVHLIEYLKQRELPAGVELLDGGTAGFDLIDFIRQADKVVIVDAVKAEGKPGQVYSFSPQDFETENPPKTSLHDITLRDVFQMAGQLGPLPEITIIGIEPAIIGPGTELSPRLKKMLPKVAELVLTEIESV